MKKLLIVLLALTVVGVLATAEASLSVGAWGRGWYSPVGSNGTDGIVEAGPGWGGNGARVGVSFTGNSDNVGFTWNPGMNGSGASSFNPTCDQAKIWVAPSSMIKFEVGTIQGDVLRGKLGNFGDVVPCPDEDTIFKRFNPSNGMLIDITPMDGVYLGAALDVPASGLSKDAYNAVQVGGGYTIAGLGMIRVQYIGNADTTVKGAIEAAFNYTGMEGLKLDIGTTYPLNADYQMDVALGVAYSKDALSVMLKSDNFFLGASGSKFNTADAIQLQYTVAAPYAVGVEVALSGMDDAGAKGSVDVFPFVKAGYDKGYLKVGFDYTAGLDSGVKGKYKLPIQMEYGF